MNVCITYKKEVTEEHKAMACDLQMEICVGCLKRNDKLSDELYKALVGCRSRSETQRVAGQCATC